MRKAIETLKNIWKIEDLRQRILITILFVVIYRFGSYVVLLGINPSMLTQLHHRQGRSFSLVKYVFREEHFQCPILHWVSCRTSLPPIDSVVGIAVPYFQKLQQGESGRRKMNQYTCYLTILIFGSGSFICSILRCRLVLLKCFIRLDSCLRLSFATIILSEVCLFCGLGERITDKGIGNGILADYHDWYIVCLPQSLFQELISRNDGHWWFGNVLD